jgi:hypothetical protein
VAVFVAELRTVDNSVDKLRFDLNPNSLRRTRHPQYADVNAALADWTGNYPTNAPSPLEWLRNPPEEISVECLFHRDKGSVDDALEKLDKFMAKGRNGRPPDLIFSWGKRYDRSGTRTAAFARRKCGSRCAPFALARRGGSPWLNRSTHASGRRNSSTRTSAAAA